METRRKEGRGRHATNNKYLRSRNVMKTGLNQLSGIHRYSLWAAFGCAWKHPELKQRSPSPPTPKTSSWPLFSEELYKSPRSPPWTEALPNASHHQHSTWIVSQLWARQPRSIVSAFLVQSRARASSKRFPRYSIALPSSSQSYWAGMFQIPKSSQCHGSEPRIDLEQRLKGGWRAE